MSADLDRARRGVALSPRTEQMTRVIAPRRDGAETRVQPPRDGTRVWDREDAAAGARAAPAAAAGAAQALALAVGAARCCSCSPPERVAAVALSGVIGGGNGTRDDGHADVRARPERPRGAGSGPRATAGLSAPRAQGQSGQARLEADSRRTCISVSPPGGSAGQGRVHGDARSSRKGVTLETVPKLTGMTCTEATAALTAQGLEIGDQTETNDLATAGTVIAQEPVAGRDGAERARPSTVTISKGPKDVRVPDLTGQDLADGARRTSAGGTEGRAPSAARRRRSAGRDGASATIPPAARRQPEGSAVNISSSRGPSEGGHARGLRPQDGGRHAEDPGRRPRAADAVELPDDTTRRSTGTVQEDLAAARDARARRARP